jgi:hypothetical protein
MKPSEITPVMIAQCGMNCAICAAHHREENTYPGCRVIGEWRCTHHVKCSFKTCKNLEGKFCYSCDIFPCARLKSLDKRYRTKYGMSEIENLFYIKEHGIKAFVKKEQKRWKCPACGMLLSCHGEECLFCL